MDQSRLTINRKRFREDFDELARIGGTGDGGVHRPALSENHLAARRWFQKRAREDGLEFRLDDAGNHSALHRCGVYRAPVLLLGSHLDSVPNGGRFDGALGLLAAYEVVRTVRDAGVQLPVDLEAIDFTDEEGTMVGLLGSRALTGTLTPEELANPRGGRAALREALARAGLVEDRFEGARRSPEEVAGFLELHIEQGSRLVDAGADIGIVTSIVGIGSYALRFRGRADHAGTTAMEHRKDAGLGAAWLMVRANEIVKENYPGCVVNFGQAGFLPGAYNIVPETAAIAMEYRAPSKEGLAKIERALVGLAEEAAARFGLVLEKSRQGCIGATPLSPRVIEVFRRSSAALGLKSLDLVSGAGHDTQAMASICDAGMIFIPSTGGSHSPREHADWQACVNGANVLLHAALTLASRES